MRSSLILSVAALAVPVTFAGTGATAATITSTASTATAGSTVAATAAAACVSNPMGIPSSGAYAGSTSTAHGSPRIHRLYYGSGSTASAVRTAKSDHAAGRIPWMSFKAPHSWSAMAGGAGDAWAKNLTVALSRSGGPVWLAVDHEPEGDGDVAVWVRMQKRLAPIVHRYSNNIAYTQISSAWTNFEGPAKYSMDRLWAGSGIDIVGSDAYNSYGQVKNGVTNHVWSEMTRYYKRLGPWAALHHVRWAMAESGYTNSAATRDPAWLNRAFTDLVRYHGIAFSYFDSTLHSVGSWSLATTVKRQHFAQILAKSARIC
jgi:hypothetical protein